MGRTVARRGPAAAVIQRNLVAAPNAPAALHAHPPLSTVPLTRLLPRPAPANTEHTGLEPRALARAVLRTAAAPAARPCAHRSDRLRCPAATAERPQHAEERIVWQGPGEGI